MKRYFIVPSGLLRKRWYIWDDKFHYEICRCENEIDARRIVTALQNYADMLLSKQIDSLLNTN